MKNAQCRFVWTFALGAGPVPGLLLSEILPGRIRAKAMAVCMAVHWASVLFSFSSPCLFTKDFINSLASSCF